MERVQDRDDGFDEEGVGIVNFALMFRWLFIVMIRFYQGAISPLFGSYCRHVPSCSQYTVEAIQEWGPWKGTWLGLKRIARCHPWGTHGYDPVPKKGDRLIKDPKLKIES